MRSMKGIKLVLIILAVVCGMIAIFFVLSSESALVLNPKGIIARSQRDLMITNISLMLSIIVPTFIFLFGTLWYVKRSKAKPDLEKHLGPFQELFLWIIPSIVVVIMAVITWEATHRLDPFRPIVSDVKTIKIQVIALDWKWLFIYPEQGIATLNFIQFPEKTPIHFELSADDSPMNSFWIPQLSGQVYTMTGMTMSLHVMADGVGEYRGRAAEINGEGYADMTFAVKSTSQADFDAWVASVKGSPLKLDDLAYKELIKHSVNSSIELYSYVEKDLFNKVVDKYMHHTMNHSGDHSMHEKGTP
mgnify:CR=1 FL=1